MYDRSSTLANVNSARHVLLARNSKLLESIPRTEAALKQQYLGAVYQSGYVCVGDKVWAIKKSVKLGKGNKSWTPPWTTFRQAQDSLKELIRCGCKQGCRGRS
jgi:hypothetical protein